MADRFDESFEAFFRDRHRSLVGIALAMVGDLETARDVVQEAMFRAARRWERVRSLDRPDMWVRRVTVNLCIDSRRRRVREIRHRHSERADVNVVLDQPVEASELWDAVRALPDRQRTAIVLRYVDDLTVADIAIVLAVTEGTVKATLSHARTALAVQMSAALEVKDT